MTTGTLLNKPSAEPTELEFALETESGFLVVLKGTGNDGRVTLAVRRRVGTPPASAIGLTSDEVRRLVNVLGELSPTALKGKEKHNVVRQQDSYLDELMGVHNTPVQGNLDLFIERDFPELANRRKKPAPRSFWTAEATDFFNNLLAGINKVKISQKQVAIIIGTVVLVPGLVLSAVAVSKLLPVSHNKPEPVAVVPAPTTAIEEFSKVFVQDMLTFNTDAYRQAQVRAMAAMNPELAQKYWKETGFPLTKKQLKAMPQDQNVEITRVTAQPISVDNFQVDVVGSVVSKGAGKTIPLHIRLGVSRGVSGKLTVTEQKDLSSNDTN